MTRPLFVPDTPSAVHTLTGGNLALSDQEKNLYLGAPEEVDVYRDANVRVLRVRQQTLADPIPKNDILEFEFTAGPQQIWLTAVGTRLDLYAGQVLYQITPSSVAQKIALITGSAADTLHIDDTVKNPVVINSGAGNDYLRVGGQHATLMSGPGSDTLRITSGISNIDSGSDDDSIHITSPDIARIFTGEGDDRVRAGTGFTYIDAGPGNDTVLGGNGDSHNILIGGDGNDHIEAGASTNVIYPGQGNNRVSQLKPTDKVYGLASDTLIPIGASERQAWVMKKLASLPASIVEQLVTALFKPDVEPVDHTQVSSSEAGKTGILIEGSADFLSRVEADLSVLRLSPNGKKLLLALDSAAQTGGSPVKIEYFDQENAQFTPSIPGDALFIRDGRPGTPAYGGLIKYNPFFSPRDTLPIVGLYHELCHAYNAVTGTAVSGTSVETNATHASPTRNRELQAVGLPIAMDPFDFDLDPTTPPTQTNPEAFTENGIRRELGLPVRTSYQAPKKTR